jgi:BrnA antitoxin of type II toxin-antitoxin system
MRAEYDFTTGERKAVISSKGKTRISIFIDNAVLDGFRAKGEAAGIGYQTMMNEALRQYLADSQRPVTEARLRAILNEVLPSSGEGLTRRPTRARTKSRAG